MGGEEEESGEGPPKVVYTVLWVTREGRLRPGTQSLRSGTLQQGAWVK